MVLYTTYNPINNAFYVTEAKPLVEPTANIAVTAALHARASPGGNYFQANSPAEIQLAMNQMLSIASAKVGRFTK